eukprot:scaffold27363_cov57-Phaeocystis_antarctica.AAC.3
MAVASHPSIDGMPSLRSVVARAAGMLASWKAGEPERDSSAGDNARGSPCAATLARVATSRWPTTRTRPCTFSGYGWCAGCSSFVIR